MLRSLLLPLYCLFTFSLCAQITRVEPPNWWVGMHSKQLQLLVQGQNIRDISVETDYPGLTILAVQPADNPNYLFVDLSIAATTQPGMATLRFLREGAEIASHPLPLKARPADPATYQGFSAADVICLLTPDRFSNGDPANDVQPRMQEKTIDRTEDFARHGGDIQGIIDHLDYFAELGYTALWPSPLLENNMPQWSYHGYAITDYYRVDPRFGTLDTYVELAQQARQRGMKLIMDGVVNHCGANHWWMQDPPFADWLNYQQQYRVTNHRRTVHQDPYAAKTDRQLLTGGWFVPDMPDLNQRNPFMARYLIQNSIWWIETLQLGGIRQDTYPYPDPDFLTDWTCAIMAEYPNFSIVGEEWSYNPLMVAYWQQGHKNANGYTSCLRSTMDFPLQRALVQGLTEPENWDTGLIKLYEALANDFVYAQPKDLLVFGDNHDMDRLYTQLGQDAALTKMALTYLLTVRGIPQLYYGTEVMLDNTGHPGDHGRIRSDFPGGWAGDKADAFTGKGLTPAQTNLQTYLRTLLQWRKQAGVIHTGETRHYGPEKGVYVYSRYNDKETVLVFLNKNEAETPLALDRFSESIQSRTQAVDVMTGKTIILGKQLSLPAKSALVLLLK